MPITICTFNANNLFVRYRFGEVFPGDRSDRSRVNDPRFGYLPVYDPDLLELFAPEQRQLCARAITNNGTEFPDVVVMQEVESIIALRQFNELHLDAHYTHAALVDSRDFRQIDVGVLSTLPVRVMRTHVDEFDPHIPGQRLFSRDCFEVQLDIPGAKHLTLFVNHFKSKYAESPEEAQRADEKRARQAGRVVEILRERFPGGSWDSSLFAVLGDLNDEPAAPTLASLYDPALGLVDALAAIPQPRDRWTHWWRSENEVSQLDHILLSPALAAMAAGPPRIERRGLGIARVLADGTAGPRRTWFRTHDGDPDPVQLDFQFPRFLEVTPQLYASDHCPVFLSVG